MYFDIIHVKFRISTKWAINVKCNRRTWHFIAELGFRAPFRHNKIVTWRKETQAQRRECTTSAHKWREFPRYIKTLQYLMGRTCFTIFMQIVTTCCAIALGATLRSCNYGGGGGVARKNKNMAHAQLFRTLYGKVNPLVSRDHALYSEYYVPDCTTASLWSLFPVWSIWCRH